MPDLTISSGGGDLTVAGDLVGRDKTTRVPNDDLGALTEQGRHNERNIEQLAAMIGKLQSDMVTVRTELALLRERLNFLVFGLVALIIVSGAVSLIVGVVARP